mmetsp:Transcript_104546/g.326025  ORF Transcript_104546/g.326025 Transcript_104546/m.326025 type:complete len:200 (-) Transcript_104546:1028-1627(-)
MFQGSARKRGAPAAGLLAMALKRRGAAARTSVKDAVPRVRLFQRRELDLAVPVQCADDVLAVRGPAPYLVVPPVRDAAAHELVRHALADAVQALLDGVSLGVQLPDALHELGGPGALLLRAADQRHEVLALGVAPDLLEPEDELLGRDRAALVGVHELEQLLGLVVLHAEQPQLEDDAWRTQDALELLEDELTVLVKVR